MAVAKMVSSRGSTLAALVVLLAAEALCRSSGPPASEPEYRDQVCNQMKPNHAKLDPQPGNGGYLIETDLQLSSRDEFHFSAGQTYKVKIVGTNDTFRGFLMVAHLPGQDITLIGRFVPQNINQQTVACDVLGVNNESAIGHSNPASTDFQSQELVWQAPLEQDGVVDFRYTLVRNFSTFHTLLRASQNLLSKAPKTTTTGPNLVAPTIDPSKYRLTFHDPPNCKPSECNVFVGIDTNSGDPDYFNIYIEGEADGWVAVGFSETRSMFAADVVACNRPKNATSDELETIDAWNSAVERRCTVDPNSDVVEFTKNYFDGRLSCSVAKNITATDPDHDLNLDSLLYVMYGRRREFSGTMELFPHEMGPDDIPKLTNERLNPVTLRASIDDKYPRPILLQVHGMIMIIAWALLAATGIVFAMCMRPALPNGEWFHVHRAFLLVSVILAGVGFVLPFAANYNRIPHGLVELGYGNIFGTSHFAVGIAVMLLHIINPIIAACRCKPDEEKHQVFQICHGIFIGKLAFTLALVNMCLGAYVMFKQITPLLWVCVGYSAFIAIVILVLGALFKCSCRKKAHKELVSHVAMTNQRQLLIFSDDEDDSEDSEEEIVSDDEEELTAFDGSLKDSINPEVSRVELEASQRRLIMSRHSTLRWIFLALFVLSSILFTVAMVVLVALQV